ncbi:YjbH domain-containing protein [Sporomusa termitida]|uniref:Exopolysaccharide biosynthesis protein YbjH n=1 Tax=Sporomusa termitida TaxID=2377 RepID=A0A517DXV1_9FIRM|nr:YjbH domain-containing protein [Sporomusa termitida]QDR82076.1 Exopolysaccharide biosynthesis protein YbjH [Sporomusa termitida]
MRKKAFLAAVAVLMAAAPVYAAPSVNGSTGLINTPSADVLQEGQFSLGYHHLEEGNAGSFVFSPAKKLELGVAGFRYDSDSNRDNQTYFNAKYSLVPETVVTPGLAIGVEDIGGEDKRTFYAAASKALPFGFRLHAGVGDGRYDGVFASLEKTFNPVGVITGSNAFPATTLIAEWDGDRMNYGARLSVVPGLKIDAGWRHSETYIGLTYTY